MIYKWIHTDGVGGDKHKAHIHRAGPALLVVVVVVVLWQVRLRMKPRKKFGKIKTKKTHIKKRNDLTNISGCS